MNPNARFQVILLPQRKVLLPQGTLAEAVAFVHGYHEVIDRQRREAVIREVVGEAVSEENDSQRTNR